MKKITILILLLSISAFAQNNTTNFTIKNNNLIWTREYSKITSPEEFIKEVKLPGGITKIVNSGDSIDFEFKFDNEPLKDYGFDRKKHPAFMGAGGIIEGIVVFDNDKYVVTISRINYISPANNFKPVPVADSVIKNNTISMDKQVSKALKIYDNYFYTLFKLN